MNETPPLPERLYRSQTDRVIAGVAGGLAEYLHVDSTVVRLVFIVLAFAGGAGFYIYLICWLLMPTRDQASAADLTAEERIRHSANQMADEVRSSWESREWGMRRSGTWLVVIGLLFLLVNLGVLTFGLIGRLWPLLLIGIGWQMLYRRR